MSLLPVWHPDQNCCTAAEIERITARAAEQLASALQSAQVASHDWADESLAGTLVETAVSNCLSQLASTGCWGSSNQLPSTILWKMAGNWLQTGWLQTRAREKPLGYAGDYKLLEAIINETCSSDPLGRIFDRFFLHQAAPTAVRNRTELVASMLVADCLRKGASQYPIASIGCGPGLDIRRGIEILPKKARGTLDVTLLDLDQQSLNYAEHSVTEVMNPKQVHTYRENLSRLAEKPTSAERIGNPQLLLCIGFFDYLENDVATDLLRLLWHQLGPEGYLLVGNFIPGHPTRTYMEWIGNWYLTYRTPAEMRDLALNAGIPSNCQRLGSEATGSNLFLQVRKP